MAHTTRFTFVAGDMTFTRKPSAAEKPKPSKTAKSASAESSKSSIKVKAAATKPEYYFQP